MSIEIVISSIVSFGISSIIAIILGIVGYLLRKKNIKIVMPDEKDNHEFQKKLAIAQIGATAGTAIGAVIVTMGISLMIFSTQLSFEAVTEDEAKSQFFTVVSSGFSIQGLMIFFAGLVVIIGSMATIIAKIKKMK